MKLQKESMTDKILNLKEEKKGWKMKNKNYRRK